ncbi:MAG: hypothetical protein AB7H96_13915 [Vicinamibacterales bacterium]
MRALIALSVALASASVPALAQSSSGSASTAPGGRFVAIGCLSKQGAGAAARYLVTDPRGEKPTVYRLQGDTALLERHVGHTIEAAGPLAGRAAAQYALKVESLVYIARTCQAPTTRTGVRP